ncbi:Glycosyl transferase family 1 [uncultured Defluviicoccus sp.]|uniref:Glycosyl transferase family 1 n=1 Tax=metagenome TaxID=256318 RepID=A0A380TE98_9ZZZZ|nr:Glycosyl transferase family 1 [uncultured Defluviicoccus sp.]
MRLYGRLPMPAGMRRFLREGLKGWHPSLFDWLSKTINSQPRLPIGGDAPGLADVIERPEFRVRLWRLVRAVRAHADQFGPVTHLIALPFFATGGSEATAASFARTICSDGKSSVLMIATDRPYSGKRLPAPPGALMLNLWDYFTLEDEHTIDAVVFAVLRAIAPQSLHIINSSACWRLVVKHGARVRHVSRLYGSIFAIQVNTQTGQREGYAADYLKGALPYLDALLSDNASFFKLSEQAFGSLGDPDKLVTVYNAAPVWSEKIVHHTDTRLAELTRPIAPMDRLQVLWAGRFDREKRPDLLIAAAKARPDIDFHVYGSVIVDVNSEFSTTDLANVHIHGPFSSAADVAGARLHHVMMFTSLWEGMPNVLLEFGSLGVPIVANVLGGVGELIDDTTGFPLSSSPSVAEYLAAFDVIRTDPATAVARARRLREKIAARHTRANFETAVRRIPGYLADTPPAGGT